MTDAEAVRVFLPSTYEKSVPYDLFARLREETPVRWVPEPAVGPWREGPGFWAVFRHADVKHVLRTPEDFSSHLGATQIRDPDTPSDLAFVQDMMLNMDPPEHSRLRRIVAAAFTPRAVRTLEQAIAGRAAALFAQGTCDFVEVAADLPVWTLAHVMGCPRGTGGCSTTGPRGSSATRTPTTRACPRPTSPRSRRWAAGRSRPGRSRGRA
ncbi:hypothetical protein ABZ907_35965 [Nonomuraea wenchangensis]